MRINIREANKSEAHIILELQKLAYQSEAALYQDWSIPPLVQTLSELEAEFEHYKILVAVIDQQIVGSVRGYVDQETGHLGRLIVNPDFQKRGIGAQLLKKIEKDMAASSYELFTGHKSIDNLRLYEKLGYRRFKTEKISDDLSFVYLRKLA